MAMIDIKIDPSPRELRVFALLWALFFVVMGVIALSTETALLKIAAFTGACFVVSILLNTDFPKRAQLMGLCIPLGILAIWAFEHYTRASGAAFFARRGQLGFERLDGAALSLLVVLGLAGALGAAAVLASPALGKALYRGWMFAALPIGWTISHILLGMVYFLVFTPIGLIMRLLGKDPMERRFQPDAPTYWIKRPPPAESSRYFRQF
ncbi:MAG: hypothetical protein KF699_03665 [Phycisphaeraceae bacterium]|nr:hypothetical protein [Phycisphaeraceae bacterium]MBX3405605.1 hypothetical protein [Phycisphaeraceae bacterium]